MDFVITLLGRPHGNNAVWIITDQLTKSAYFIHFHVGQSTILADKYRKEIVKLHGIPIIIVSITILVAGPVS